MNLKLPHEIKSDETKQKILDATEKLLVQYDFKYLTVRNICEISQVAYGSFYHHFKCKQNLLYVYTNNLYEKIRLYNPAPSWISPDDYIKNALWHILVYGYFCESLGKPLVKYLYENSPQEMFEQTFDKTVMPIIEQAYENGFIDSGRNRSDKLPPVKLLKKDLVILYRGILLWWSCYADNQDESLHETLEHLCFNMFYAYCSDKYRSMNYPHMLLTEYDKFPESIRMSDINIKKSEKQ